MLYQISKQARHVDIPTEFDDVVDREIEKLLPIVASYPEDTMLRIIVDDASGTDEVEIVLRLSLPGNMLVSRETGAANMLPSVFDQALKQMRRQVLHHKDN